MDWPEALEIVVGRTRHGRYRELCADGHPDCEHYRAEVLRQAGGPLPSPEEAEAIIADLGRMLRGQPPARGRCCG